MARDSEYNALKQDYRKKVAEVQDLRETAREKDIVWKEYVSKTKVTEKLTRELCEMILAKDRSEMVLGKEYSWDNEKINDLIRKAMNSYRNRIKEETAMLNGFMDQIDDKDGTIERLGRDILQLRSNGGILLPDSDDEEYDPIAAAQSEIAEDKQMQAAIGELSPSIQKGFAEGGISLKVIGTKGEEKDPVTKEEQEAFNDAAEQSARTVAQVAKNATLPHSDAEKLRTEHETAKKERHLAHVVDLNDLMDETDETMWMVYDAIGGGGHSRIEAITKHINDNIGPAAKPVDSRRVARAIKDLLKQAVINNTRPENPLSPNMMIYRLTDTGKNVYEAHFHKAPVLSEWERVIKEHDNVDHGYPILALAEMMRSAGWYDEVIEANRSSAIKVGGGKEYICDILGIRRKNGVEVKDYWEYERNNHNQNNFNEKCNKMMKVTQELNFITPNRKTADGLSLKVDDWIKERRLGSLRNICVNICTAKDLRDRGITDDQWMIYHYTFADGVKVTGRKDPATE